MSHLIIHSHELNQDGTPIPEYRSRLSEGANLLVNDRVNSILLVGGKATKGVDISHSEAGKRFLEKLGIHGDCILQDPLGALDTVGEVIFSRIYLENQKVLSPIYLSSDYHERRIREVSSFVWGKKQDDILFQGVSSDGSWSSRSLQQEEASLDAFRKTFEGVKAGDLDSILERLWKKHGLYRKHPNNPLFR